MKELQIYDLFNEFTSLTKDFDIFEEEKIIEIIEVQRDRCNTINEIIHESQFFLHDSPDIEEKLVKKYITSDNLTIFDDLCSQLESLKTWSISNVKDSIDVVMQKHGLDMPKFAKPLRIVLTGSLSSPSIDSTVYLLGKESCIKRINSAKTLIS